ncbi:MAG: nucleotidyltransferase family protein [Candidatus Loosdrechtia sp.]|uniref:nucleotidyltransferase family protein n=1 Tax=Candidatus Loosdrechtia sp. TaxID=3101272 RepID=UPI003A6C2F27|nr:MAG: nucleotidyltransferase family protein [Candidatus Jettenia sp. AMX2]
MEMYQKNVKEVSEILRILSDLKIEIRQRYKCEVKGIFGSYVRGEQKNGSDIDVLVEFDEGANLLDLTGISLFLEEKLNCHVDVVPESAIRKEIKDSILKEAAYL